MLQSMRHLAQTKVVKGLMTLLIVSFALWGIGDIFRGNALERSVAKAGKVSITVQALNQEFEAALTRARQMFGAEMTAQQAKQMGVLDKTLDGMIERAVLDQEINKLGIDVSAQTVLEKIGSQPQFRDKNGRFNKALFQQLLEQARLNERTFLEQGRKDMARQQVVDILNPHDPAPLSEIDGLYKSRGQKRVFDVVTLKNDSITDIAAPDETSLHAYYDKNPQAFTTPEYREMTIARLSTDDVMKDITVTDDQVKKEYDAKIDQLTQPERRDLLQVVLQDEAKAKQLAAAAKQSGDLIKAAKAMGYDAVSINQTDENSLPAELGKPVFALPIDQISDPIKSNLGWHVIAVKKIIPAGKPQFTEVKDQLRESMQRDQAIEAMTRTVNKLDDELAAGHALEDIADALKLRLIKVPAVDANGKTPDGKDPAELPTKTEVLKAAFGQASGEVSPIIDDKNGNFFVVRTDGVTPSAVKPFDQVKDQVIAAVKKDEQATRAAAKAEDIAKAMRDGKAASSFAGQSGIEIRTSKPVSLLGDADAALPASVYPKVYNMKKGEVMRAAGPDEQTILKLADVTESNMPDDAAKAAKTKIASEIEGATQNELTEQYLKYLHTLFPIKIDQDMMESLRQQGG